jgi:hypothetical protein
MATITGDDVGFTTVISSPAGAARSNQSVINLRQPTATNPGEAELVAPNFSIRAQVFLEGKSGESVAGWRFGFIQLKFVTTDWAHYRGPTKDDGDVFVALDRPHVRAKQLCRDTYLPDEAPYTNGPPVFYDPDQTGAPLTGGRWVRILVAGTTIPDSGELELAVDFADSPGRSYPLRESNTLFTPPRDNFLREVQTEAAFITLFAAREPGPGAGGAFHFLRHVYWNVRWQARFTRDAAGVIAVERSHEMELNVQRHSQTGVPNDWRFRPHITDTKLPVCNTVMRNAFGDPKRKQYSRHWRNWHVGHPVT